MEKHEMKELTRSEEQVMQAIWAVGQGFANEIVAAMEEPRPAYNTILTIVRILETKGFVGHETFNRSNRYYPLISREDYSQQVLGHFASRFFARFSAVCPLKRAYLIHWYSTFHTAG